MPDLLTNPLFWWKVAIAAVFTPVVKFLAPLAGVDLHWVLAAVISLVVVFAGWFVFVDLDPAGE